MGKLTAFSLFFIFTSSTLFARDPRIDAMFADYDREGVPGASVMVIKDDQIVHQQGYGLAYLQNDVATTAQTNYRLASLTKAFTAMAVVILKERGLLEYNDLLQKYIPEFPSYARTITIRHLLNHQSGLVDYEELISSDQQEPLLDEDVIRLLTRQSRTYFTPGSQYRYSNGGYATLAALVARVSGQPFQDFLSENIFKPLGMDNTIAFVDGINEVSHRAYGYTYQNGRFAFTDQSITSAVLGDGGVYSSLSDIVKWDRALYGGGVVSDASLAEIFTPGRLSNGSSTSYGFGWEIDNYGGQKRISHTGSTIGFRHAIQRFPSSKLTVVVLINRANSSPWDLAAQISDLYLSR